MHLQFTPLKINLDFSDNKSEFKNVKKTEIISENLNKITVINNL